MSDKPQRPRRNNPPDAQTPDGKVGARAAGLVTDARSGARSKSKTKQPAKQPGRAKGTAATPEPIPDPRVLEREMAKLTRLLEEQDFASEGELNAFIQQLNTQAGPLTATSTAPATPLEEAQDLIYQAAGLRGKRRKALISKALAISPDCADAYVMLAEDCDDIQQARAYYEQGMQAGERAIGQEKFAQLAADGEFWHYIETRPYMRAREGLAYALWGQDERAAAVGHLLAMLQLNPEDNQGVRYRLASWLLATDDQSDYKQIDALLRQYAEDASAFIAYSRLLLTLRTSGPGKPADAALESAMMTNPFVPFYLLGILPLPKQLPDYYGIGDHNEAIIYLEEGGLEAWITRDDDIMWLAGAIVRLGPPPEPEPRRPHTRPHKRKRT